MKHLSEEEMVGQAYGEGPKGAPEHLESCAECGQAFADLKSRLDEILPIEPPHRDPFYGEQVWEAISDSLTPRKASRWNWLRSPLVQRLGYAALCAALAAGAFYAGRMSVHRKPAGTATDNHPQPRQPILVVVLGDHLDRSERLLVELKHVNASNTEMLPPLRDEARSLLAANRVCRQNAEKTGDPALEKALDHLDHLLNQLADQPGGLNPAAIERLQNEMNSDGLLFEVRVLRSRVRGDRVDAPDRPSGGEA